MFIIKTFDVLRNRVGSIILKNGLNAKAPCALIVAFASGCNLFGVLGKSKNLEPAF
jgi:hypothetical protein